MQVSLQRVRDDRELEQDTGACSWKLALIFPDLITKSLPKPKIDQLVQSMEYRLLQNDAKRGHDQSFATCPRRSVDQ